MAVKKQNTSLVKNKTLPLENRGTVKNKQTTKKKKYVTSRNPTRYPLVNWLIATSIAAAGLVGFDLAVETFAPTISNGIKTGAKFGIGFLVGNYGRNVPVIGQYATGIQNTFYVLGFVDLFTNWLVPHVRPYLPNAAPQPVAQPQKVQDPNTGELGMLHQFNDGSSFFVVDNQPGVTSGSIYAS